MTARCSAQCLPTSSAPASCSQHPRQMLLRHLPHLAFPSEKNAFSASSSPSEGYANHNVSLTRAFSRATGNAPSSKRRRRRHLRRGTCGRRGTCRGEARGAPWGPKGPRASAARLWASRRPRAPRTTACRARRCGADASWIRILRRLECPVRVSGPGQLAGP